MTSAPSKPKRGSAPYITLLLVGGPGDGYTNKWYYLPGTKLGDVVLPRTITWAKQTYRHDSPPGADPAVYDWIQPRLDQRDLHAAWTALNRAWGPGTAKTLQRMAHARHRIRRAVR